MAKLCEHFEGLTPDAFPAQRTPVRAKSDSLRGDAGLRRLLGAMSVFTMRMTSRKS